MISMSATVLKKKVARRHARPMWAIINLAGAQRSAFFPDGLRHRSVFHRFADLPRKAIETAGSAGLVATACVTM